MQRHLSVRSSTSVARLRRLPTALIPVGALAANPTCTILDLTLGPLHLDLLGLIVDLNQVHLTITGQTGPGNLLGNLLCGLANALNGGPCQCFVRVNGGCFERVADAFGVVASAGFDS